MKMIRIFISNEDDRILCIQNDDDHDTFVCKVTTLRWPVPHACRVVSRRIAYIRVYVNMCYVNHLNMCLVIMRMMDLGDLCALVNLVNCVLDDVSLFWGNTYTLGDFNWWRLFWWEIMKSELYMYVIWWSL